MFILASLLLIILFFVAKSKRAQKIILRCFIIGIALSAAFTGWNAYYSQIDYEAHEGDCCSPPADERGYKPTVCARCHHDLDDSPLHTLNILAPYIYGASLIPLYTISITATIKSRK